MSATVSDAADRPLVTDHYAKGSFHSRSGSLSSRSMGRVAGNAVNVLKSPSISVGSQGHERRRSTDTSGTKPSRANTKDSVDSRTDKGTKSSTSVVPTALKNVGRKLGMNNSITGLQFNPGLYNLGNSCYLNSTLQGLMSTRLLENMVKFSIPSDFAGRLFPERSPALRNERGGDYALPYVRGMETCMTFIRTLENGWKLRDTTNVKQRVSMSPRELRNRLGAKYDQYLDFQQQDAHEFLRHLLDCMYMEEFDVIKKRQPPIPKRRRGQPPVEPSPPPVPEEERLIPFVDQVFGGQLASMLICSSCKKVSHTYEPFMDLSISIRSEEDKESKRNRLKAFTQRFTRRSGRPVLRPLSNPPSPRKPAVELEPTITVDRRRSAEILVSRSDSDPEETKPRSAVTLSPPDSSALPDSMTRLGRRVSMQFGLRKSGERSRSREQVKDDTSNKGSKKKEEAAYLRRIMADTGASKNPLELLKSGLGANGSANGDSITAAAASWLRLGPTNGPSLLHCLRQFTAVESLEGDNMVGCSRCWKLANPGYVSKQKRKESSPSSSSSEDSSDDEDEPPPARGKDSSVVAESAQSNAGTLTDTPDSISINTRTSETSHADSSYRGPPIPSISTTSPSEVKTSILRDAKVPLNGLHSATASNATSSVYLTPASSRHGSIRRTNSSTTGGDVADDSASTASASDTSVAQQRPREVRVKVPSLPKSQRVTLRRAYKRYLIAVPPPVLVIHLKRFQQVSRTPISLFASLKKIDDFISFPEYLDLKPFIAPRREEFGFRSAKIKNDKGAYDEHVMYRLYAVVVHIGNMLGGHYVAYTALQNVQAGSLESETLPRTGPAERRWSFQSDQVVRVASLDEVLAAKAYLCFYERISEAPPSPGTQSPNGNRKK